jgi:hypothetical protein
MDRDFMWKRPKSPPFNTLRVGDRIPLDGEIVHSLVEPVVQVCIRLITAMDQWIVKRQSEAIEKTKKRGSSESSAN